MVNPFYPFQGKRFQLSDGLNMNYLDEGSGDPVVMVHGNPSWSIYYRNLVKTLSPSFRTIAPDHIGCGLSDKPGDDKYPYTLSRRADDLQALLDSLGVKENITLVLHDWGGMIGMTYAVRNPGAVKRIVVLNTSAFILPDSKPFPMALRLCRTPLGTVLIRGFNAFAAGTALIGCKRNPMPPALRAAYTAPYDSWSNRIATLRFVQDIPLDTSHPSYAVARKTQDSLSMFSDLPMLICWGEKDFVFDSHFLDGWMKRFPSAEVRRFPDCGHYILEDAAEDVCGAVSEFLSRHK